MAKWIKLHTEILTDPKMGRMSDKLFRRTIELFLLAGKEDADGALPSVQDIAWTLHTTEKEIAALLADLTEIGIIEKTDAGYAVANFVSRQMSNMTEAERKAVQRERQRTMSGQLSQKCPDIVRTDDQNMSRPEEEVEEEVDIEVEEELRESVKTATVEQKPAPAPKPTKRPYGNYRHVLLTDEEYAKLAERFPKDAALLIQKLDNYLENNRKKHYDNHYLTILTWARKDAEQAPKPERRLTFAEIVQKQEAGEL